MNYELHATKRRRGASRYRSEFETSRNRRVSACVAVLAALTAAFGLPCASNAELVAHYQFDEPADHPTNGFVNSAPAVDGIIKSSGTVLGNGAAIAANFSRGVPGVFGTAYEIRKPSLVADMVGLDINTGGGNDVRPTNNFSISFWVKPTQLGATGSGRLMDASAHTGGGALQTGFRFLINASNQVVFAVARNTSMPSVVQSVPNTINTVSLNQWYFVASRYSTTGQLQVTVLPGGLTDVTDAIVAAATTSVTSDGITPNYAGGFTRVNLPSAHADSSMTQTLFNNVSMAAFYDDIAFFNHVATDEQLANAYNHGAQYWLEPPVVDEIPEPSAIVLMAIGLAMFAVFGWRRRLPASAPIPKSLP